MSDSLDDKRSGVGHLADQLGLSLEEAWRMKKDIEWCRISGPQRYVIAGRLEVKRERA